MKEKTVILTRSTPNVDDEKKDIHYYLYVVIFKITNKSFYKKFSVKRWCVYLVVRDLSFLVVRRKVLVNITLEMTNRDGEEGLKDVEFSDKRTSSGIQGYGVKR